MSSEGLLKNGKKRIVIVGAGAAGMVSVYDYTEHILANRVSLAPRLSPSTPTSSA